MAPPRRQAPGTRRPKILPCLREAVNLSAGYNNDMSITEEQARQEVAKLVANYQSLTATAIKKYTEADTRRVFIMPLFQALGWDVYSREEVAEEVKAASGRVDYVFKLHGVSQFYLEAKALRAELTKPEYIKQAITYAYNKGITWAVLTDFEGLQVYNAQTGRLFINLSYDNYLKDFDDLWLLSKESLESNALNEKAEKYGALPPRLGIEQRLYNQLRQWRGELSDQLHLYNKDLSEIQVGEVIQRLFNRLIFIRTCEDRRIEDRVLLGAVHEWRSKGRQGELIETLHRIFRDFDGYYDSDLFEIHLTDQVFIESTIIESIINGLYEIPGGMANYDFSLIDADVLGQVYEQYLGYVTSLEKQEIKDAQAAKRQRRKEHGIYYTPRFITNYIVKETVGRFLEESSYNEILNMKILDPACGSGSFLIRAYDELLSYHAYRRSKSVSDLDQYERLPILTRNVFGVDLDMQAIEIARLNLLLRSLAKRETLPSLADNIRQGNSLISGTKEELKSYFGDKWREKKPFNWEQEFEDIMAQGGFDVVIGNPPYGAQFDTYDKDYLYQNFQTTEYQLDSYLLFIERAITLLNDKGFLGLIVPNPWLTNIKVTKLRLYVLNTCKIKEITHYPVKVFGQSVVDTVVVIMQKEQDYQERSENQTKITIYREYPEPELMHTIPQAQWERTGILNIFVDASSLQLLRKIEQNTMNLKVVCDVVVGIKPYQVGKGQPKQTREIVENRSFDATNKKDNTYRRYIRGSDINRYCTQWDQTHWISYGQWLAEPRKRENFDAKEKIIIRQTGDSLIATLDREQFLCLNNTHTINLKNTLYDLRYILALINSHLMNYYYQSLNPEKGEALAEVKATNVKRLPIRHIDFDNPAEKKMHDDLVALVERMLELNKRLAPIRDTYCNERDELLREINRTDEEIDNLVYDIYGLNEEERKIVKGG